MALHLLYSAALIALIYPLVSEKRGVKIGQHWSSQLVHMLGLSLPQALATAVLPGGLLVANHISWLDIFVINALAPSVFVSKDDVKSWPIFGWMSQRLGTIFIERGSRRAAHRTAEHMNQCLSLGQRIVVFPEGTTGDGLGVLPFHGALLQAAVETGCSIQPVALRYLDEHGHVSPAAAYIGDTTLWESLRAIAGASGLRVEAHFLSPVSAVGSDRRHLSATLHRHIAHVVTRGHPAP